MAKFNSLKYGLGKSKNITNINEGYDLLDFIYFKKIKYFELSNRYNKSIPILSSFIKKNKCRARIFYKIDNLKLKINNFDSILYNLKKIRDNLDIEQFENISLHQNDYRIISNNKIIKFLENIKKNEIAKTIGTSVYTKKNYYFQLKQMYMIQFKYQLIP